MHPVFASYATFFQRTYDQLSQDVCVNHNPATFLVFGASMYSMNDVTHLCFYDIPLLSNIPNLVYLAPATLEEYKAMLAGPSHRKLILWLSGCLYRSMKMVPSIQ